MNIRELEERDYDAVAGIARMLGHTPDGRGWFSPKAYEKLIPFDIRVQRGFVAELDGLPIGFITYTSYEYSPFIGWIAVDPDYHRKGAGARLLRAVEQKVKEAGGTELRVETPTKETGIGTDYERTYNFYEGTGFKVHAIRKLGEPGFESDCDIAVLRKVLE